MTEPRWSDDDALLADLKAALAQAGPPDEALLESGRSAFAWRTVDAELAALTYDSLLDELTVVRGQSGGTADGPRSLVFEAGDVSVELDVLPGRIVGQIVPGAAGEVVVQTPTEDLVRATADDAGLFSVTVTTPDGLVRLRCTTAAGTVVTDWVRI
jgi:hypothetical protein